MKKVSPNLIGFIIAAIMLVASVYIYQHFLAKKSEYLLDNNSDESYKIQVGQTVYTLAAHQTLPIPLGKGMHHIIVKNEKDSLISQQKIEVKKLRGLVNIGHQTYFIFGLPYGVKVNVDSIFEHNKTTYQGKKYFGPLKIDSSFYIEDFYYNLNENFPSLTKSSLNDTLRTKIFREGDFKQFYFEHFE